MQGSRLKSARVCMQVGNKMDMDSDRIVSQEGARAFAQAKQIHYIETSAKENLCVSEMFELVASSILDKVTHM
jgi:hypothetical protein